MNPHPVQPIVYSAKSLLLSLATLLAVLMGYNGLIAHTAKKSQRQQKLDAASALSPQTDCLLAGNSLVECGIDPNTFDNAWASNRTTTANIALGATLPPEQYILLKHALQKPHRLRYFIYGFLDDQLTLPSEGKWSTLIGNRALAYYDPVTAAHYYS